MIRGKSPSNPIDLSLADELSEDNNYSKAVVNDQKISDLIDNMSVTSKNTGTEGWRNCIECPKDFFEVTVQYVNELKNTIFVMEQQYEQPATKLLRSINSKINAQTPSLSAEDIREGCVYAAPFDGVYYRAEVVSVSKENETTKIRLIDYGNEFECKFADLKAPLPIMRSLNSYGISVRPICKQKVEVDDVILIKLVDTADSSGTFIAEIQRNDGNKQRNVTHVPASPLQMIVERGLLRCFISYIFPEKNAVLATFNDSMVDEQLKAMSVLLESGDNFLEEVKVGEWMALLIRVILVSVIVV